MSQRSDDQLVIQNQLKAIHNTISTMRRVQAQALLGHSKRDIYQECDYPDPILLEHFTSMYEREGAGLRVVNVLPGECFKLLPEVVEVDDPGVETPLEEAWKEQATHLSHYMELLDEQSGIGGYGVLLLGIGDGRDLREPVAGLERCDDTTIPEQAPANEYKLLFMRVFPQALATVAKYDTDIKSKRYGQPLEYMIQFADPNTLGDVAASGDMNTRYVHWTRVVHAADNIGSNEVIGRPRQKPVFNRLMDLSKVYGGTSEAMWKMGFPGISFQSLPGWEDAEFDEEATKAQVELFMNSLQNYMTTQGMEAKVLNTPVAASESERMINAYIQNISMTISVPWRVFVGSEAGQLASGQDSATWNARLRRRQTMYLTDRVVKRLLNRLIWLGVLPYPDQDGGKYHIHWPDLDEPTETDKASRAETLTKAIATYIQSGADRLVPPVEYLTRILGLSLEEAEAIEKAARKYVSFAEEDAENELDEPPAQANPNPADTGQQPTKPAAKPEAKPNRARATTAATG